jgi:hypothetical protein
MVPSAIESTSLVYPPKRLVRLIFLHSGKKKTPLRINNMLVIYYKSVTCISSLIC